MHFIRITDAGIEGDQIHSVTVTRSTEECLAGCEHIKHCIGVVIIAGITCVYYTSTKNIVNVISSLIRNTFLLIKGYIFMFFLIKKVFFFCYFKLIEFNLIFFHDNLTSVCKECIVHNMLWWQTTAKDINLRINVFPSYSPFHTSKKI